jgi:cytochrome P450 family 135
LTAQALPPGPRYPRALQTLGWTLRTFPFLERCRERYGDMFTLRIANEETWVVLSNPEHVKQVFTGDPGVFHAGEANVVLLPLLGDHSVLLLDDGPHMEQRKLLLPPLHGKRMERYGELMGEIAEAELERWPLGERMPVLPRMQAVTLEVIIRAVFGVESGARLDEVREVLRQLLAEVMDPMTLVLLATLGPRRFRRLPMVRRTLAAPDAVLYEEIARRRDDPALEEHEDILSLLLLARHEDGSPMSDRELRDELMTLLVAGHETTATALSWAVERLVRHPDKLERLRAELAAGEEEYLDAVIKETLRLRPVLPVVVRQLTEPVEIGGRRFPTGVRLAPCIHLVHRDEDVYPDPRAFRPERFLERPAGTYTWIPFGGGVRRCLGGSFAIFEMKRVLAAIVGRLELRAAEPASERVRRRAITLTPARGAEVIVERRQPSTPVSPRQEEPVPG